MKKTFSHPSGCRLTAGISEKEWNKLMPCLNAVEHDVKAGGVIFHEGDPADRLGIVVSGRVAITRDRLDGTRVVIEQIGPGDSFGASYVYAGAPKMSVAIRAVEPTKVIILEAERIPKMCGKACPAHSRFIRNTLTVISIRNFQVKQKLRIVSQRTTRGKLMLFLHIRAKRAGSNEFDIPFNRQQLADYLYVDRCALSTEISKLKARKILDCRKNHFKLLK